MHQLQPQVGQWYLCLNIGQKFEVLGVEDGVIELQDEWGAMGEISSDGWFAVDLEASSPPMDFSDDDRAKSWLFRGSVDEFLHGDAADDVGEWDKGMEHESVEDEGQGATRAPL